MAISTQEIKNVLEERGIHHLYHANTVATTSTFLKVGGLLSRGAVEDAGMIQSPQQTDEKDKELGIWYDIFFDSVDIHQRANDLNQYGPIMFVFSTDLLLLDNLTVRITKDNPIRWDSNTPIRSRYFDDIQDLWSNYIRGAFYQHLTICDMIEIIPFTPYLEELVIDNPFAVDNTYFEKAHIYLQNELLKNYPHVQLIIRECPDQCKCKVKYQGYKPGYLWHKYHIT